MLQKEANVCAAGQLHEGLLSRDEQLLKGYCLSHGFHYSVKLVPNLATLSTTAYGAYHLRPLRHAVGALGTTPG